MNDKPHIFRSGHHWCCYSPRGSGAATQAGWGVNVKEAYESWVRDAQYNVKNLVAKEYV
jgi:hypothetical protein